MRDRFRAGDRRAAKLARGRLFKLVAVALGVALAALVGEVGLRIARASYRASQEADGRVYPCDRTSPHAELVYEGVPGACQNNGWGFADVEHTLDPTQDTLRIVVVGDSVAMAQGVPMEAGLCRVLERTLAAKLGRSVEVVAVGHGGYDTAQELFLLEHDVLRLRPRVIVLLYVLNDADDAVHGSSSGNLSRYYDRPPSYLFSWLEGARYAIEEHRSEARCPQPWASFSHCAHEDEVARNFGRLGEISRRGHVPLVVAIHPFLTAPLDGPGYLYGAVHERISSLARNAGAQAVDLREAYRGHAVDEVAQSPDDPLHPNEVGHGLVGSFLARTLAERGDL